MSNEYLSKADKLNAAIAKKAANLRKLNGEISKRESDKAIQGANTELQRRALDRESWFTQREINDSGLAVAAQMVGAVGSEAIQIASDIATIPAAIKGTRFSNITPEEQEAFFNKRSYDEQAERLANMQKELDTQGAAYEMQNGPGSIMPSDYVEKRNQVNEMAQKLEGIRPTEEQLALLNRNINDNTAERNSDPYAVTLPPLTLGDSLTEAVDSMQKADRIDKNWNDNFFSRGVNDLVGQEAQRQSEFKFNQRLGKLEYGDPLDKIGAGLGVVSDMVGTLFNNKAATAEMISEMGVDIFATLAGGAGVVGTAETVGYASKVFRDNMNRQLEENGTISPEKTTELFQEALLAGGIDMVTDKAIASTYKGGREATQRLQNAINKRNKPSATADVETQKLLEKSDTEFNGNESATDAKIQREAIEPSKTPEELKVEADQAEMRERFNQRKEAKKAKESTAQTSADTAEANTPNKKRSRLDELTAGTAKVVGRVGLESAGEGVQSAIEEDAFGKDFDLQEDGANSVYGATMGMGISGTVEVAGAARGAAAKGAKAALLKRSQKADQLVETAGTTPTSTVSDQVTPGSAKTLNTALDMELETDGDTTFTDLSENDVDNSGDLAINQKMSTITSRFKKVQDSADVTPIEKANQRRKLLQVGTQVASKGFARMDQIEKELDKGGLTKEAEKALLNEQKTLGNSLKKNSKQLRDLIETHNNSVDLEADTKTVESGEANSEQVNSAAKNIILAGLSGSKKVTDKIVKRILKHTDKLDEKTILAVNAMSSFSDTLSSYENYLGNIDKANKAKQSKRRANNQSKGLSARLSGATKTQNEVIGLSTKNGNRGGFQFMQEMAVHLTTDNAFSASQTLEEFRAFANNHKVKAERTAEMATIVQQIANNDTTNADRLKELEKLTGLTVNADKYKGGFAKLNNNIQQEAKLLDSMLNDTEAAYQALTGEDVDFTQTTATNDTVQLNTEQYEGTLAPAAAKEDVIEQFSDVENTNVQDNEALQRLIAAELDSGAFDGTDEGTTDTELDKTDIDALNNAIDRHIEANPDNGVDDVRLLAEVLDSLNDQSEPDARTASMLDALDKAEDFDGLLDSLNTIEDEYQSEDVSELSSESRDLRQQILDKRSELADIQEEYLGNENFDSQEDRSTIAQSIQDIKDEIKALKQSLQASEGVDTNYDSSESLEENTAFPEWFNQWLNVGERKSIFRRFESFSETLMDVPDRILNFLDLDTVGFDRRQQTALNTLGQFIQDNFSKLDDIIISYADTDGAVNDKGQIAKDSTVFGLLQDSAGNLLPAVKEALLASAFLYANQTSADNTYRTREEVASQLGIKVQDLPYSTYIKLRFMGGSRDMAAESIGINTLRALGISANPDTMAPDLYTHLTMMLGGYGLVALTDGLYLEETTTSVQLENDDGDMVTRSFAGIRPVGERDEEGYLANDKISVRTRDVMDAFKETGNLIDKLFGGETYRVKPKLRRTPRDKFTALDSINNSRNRGSEQMIDAAHKQSNKEHRVNQTTYGLVNDLPTSLLNKALGVKSEEDLEQIQQSKRAGEGAKGNAARMQFDNFKDFVSDLKRTAKGLGGSFYMEVVQHTQGRFGFKQNVGNAQTSKVDRGLVSMPEWEQQVKFSDQAKIQFVKLGIAQALGVGIDKLSIESAIKEFENKIRQPNIVAAVEALDVLNNPNATAKEKLAAQRALVAGIEAGGENLHSLQGLVNLHRMQTAQKDPNAKDFFTDITIEIDGITNGVFLGATQFPVGDPNTPEGRAKIVDIFRRTGVSFDKNDKSYGEEIEQGMSDNYMQLARTMLDKVSKSVKGNAARRELVDAIERVFPIERKSVKDGLMTFLYGSSVNSIVGRFGDSFIEKVYDNVEKMALGKAVNIGGVIYDTSVDEQRKNAATALQKEIETIKKSEAGKAIDAPDLTVLASQENYDEALLDYSLQLSDVNAIKAALKKEYAPALKEALNETFGAMDENRKVFSTLMNDINSMFLKVLNYNLDLALQDYVAANPEYKTSWGLPKTVADEVVAKVTTIMPSIPFIYSDANDLNTYIQLAQEGRDLTKNGLKKINVEVKTKEAVIVNKGQGKEAKQSSKRRTYEGRKQGFYDNISTRIAPLSIQSLDAGTMAQMFNEDMDFLGTHDGLTTAAANMDEAAVKTNTAAMKTVKGVSLGSVPLAVIDRLQDNLSALVGNNVDFIKSFNITDIKVKAQEYADLTQEYRDAVFAAMYETNQYYSQNGGSINPEHDAELASEFKDAWSAQQPITTSDFGDFNPDHTNSEMDDALAAAAYAAGVKLGTKGSELPFKALFNTSGLKAKGLGLVNTFKNNRANAKMLKMIDQLQKMAGDDVKVFVITPETSFDDTVLTKADVESNDYGFYDAGSKTIYIKSGAFNASSPLTTVAHEAVHALTTEFLNGDNLKGARKAIYDNFVSLYEEAKFQLAGEDFYGLTSLDEFIAESFSNPAFQERLKEVKTSQLGRSFKLKGKVLQKAQNLFNMFVTNVRLALFGTSEDATDPNLLDAVINVGSQIVAQQAADAGKSSPTKRILKSKPNGMGVSEVFDTLGANDQNGVTARFSRRLRNLQKATVEHAVGAENAQLKELTDAGALDAIISELDNKAKPRSTFYGDFGLSNQGRYVAEQLHTVFADFGTDLGNERGEIRKVYEAAKSQLTVDSFLEMNKGTRFEGDRNAARRQYDMVFVNRTDEDPMWRFFVLANTSEPFNDALHNISVDSGAQSINLGQKLLSVLQHIFNKMSRLGTGGSAVTGNAAKRIDSISRNLALHHTHQANKARAQSKNATTVGDDLNNTLRGSADTIRESIEGILGDQSTIGRMVGTTFAFADDKGTDAFMEVFNRFSNDSKRLRNSLASKLANELAGVTDVNMPVVQLLRKSNAMIDQLRQKHKQWTKKAVLNAFDTITEAEEQALTHVFLRNDVTSLGSEINYDLLDKYLSNDRARQQRIDKLEAELKSLSPKEATYLANQAEALGYYMQTNVAVNYNVAKNAHNIANLFGTNRVPPKNTVDLIPVIDELATLHGLSHTDVEQRLTAQTVLRRERQRGADNGINAFFTQHRVLKQQFAKNNDAMFARKGFTSQLVNTHLTVDYVVKGSADHQLKLASGYTEHHEINADPIDKHGTKMIAMVIEDGGLSRRVTGAMSYTAKHLMGTRVQDTWNNDGADIRTGDIEGAQQTLLLNMKNQTKNLFTQRNTIKVGSKPMPHVIPSYKKDGKVKEARYEMAEAYRSDMLEKDYRMSEVLGAMAGSLVDKNNSESINDDVIDILGRDYGNNPRKQDYVEISADSTDKKLREIWDMLPYEAKRRARLKFGDNRLMVRNEQLDLLFGYKKKSMADMFDPKNAQELGHLRRGLRWAIEASVGPEKTPKVLRAMYQGEQAWTETIGLIKDIYVVRNIFTTMGNVMSNNALLAISGVPLKEVIRYQTEGWQATNQYLTDEKALYDLGLKRASTSDARRLKLIDRDMDELSRSMRENPVAVLIKENLLQTIVEDVVDSEDGYSYKSKLMKRIGEKTENVPAPLKQFAGNFFMTPDSAMGKAAREPIALSDFVARYAQYKHVTTRSFNPMDHRSAINYVEANFVNYDIPTNSTLQYFNDLMPASFTKYPLRIFRPFMRLLIENMGNAAGTLSMASYLGMSTPMEAMLFNKSPLGLLVNPLDYADAPLDIAPVNAVLHMSGVR